MFWWNIFIFGICWHRRFLLSLRPSLLISELISDYDGYSAIVKALCAKRRGLFSCANAQGIPPAPQMSRFATLRGKNFCPPSLFHRRRISCLALRGAPLNYLFTI